MHGKEAIGIIDVLEDNDKTRREFAREALNYFYPVHYRFGMEMEQAMSQGRLDRKQAAMLWMIHSRTVGDGWVRRKDVETELRSWFDMSNSKISRMVTELARGTEKLIETAEAPDSGREKVLRLTPQGLAYVDGMIDATVRLLHKRMAHLTLEEQADGLRFLNRAFRLSTS